MDLETVQNVEDEVAVYIFRVTSLYYKYTGKDSGVEEFSVAQLLILCDFLKIARVFR